MRLLPESGLIPLLALGAVACCRAPVRADEKGDELLRQVKAAVHALEPIVGEYTVTVHGKTGDTVSKCKQVSAFNSKGGGGSRDLPQSVFNLLEPTLPASTATRYLGRQTVEGQTYEVVEVKQPVCTVQLFVGSDSLIHRARTRLGTARPGLGSPIDPKTGRRLTPTEMLDAQIKSASGADANAIEVVVTGYHKLRTFAPRPDIPAPPRTLTLVRKGGFPQSMALSPHGGLIALAFNDNTLQIMDAATGAQTPGLQNLPAGVRAPAFSPDGTRLAASGRQTPGAIWEVATGKQLLALTGAAEETSALSFSPDGAKLAGAAIMSGKVVLWDAATGNPLLTLNVPDTHEIAFASDSKTLATLNYQRETEKSILTLWDAATGESLHTLEVTGWPNAALSYSPNGQWLAVNQPTGGILILNADTGEKIRELRGEGGRATTMRFSADSKTLVVLDQDERGDMPTYQPGVVLWNTATWQITRAFGLASVGVFLRPEQISIASDGYSFVAMETFGKGPMLWTVPND